MKNIIMKIVLGMAFCMLCFIGNSQKVKADIIYFPQGVEVPDYCVYRFTAEKGNYYHGLENIDFIIEELEG